MPDRHMQMIENSDRGITLNKTLAWTIGVGLILAGIYVGTQVATLSRGLDEMARTAVSATQSRAQLDSRVNALEISAGQSRVQFDTLYKSLQEIKTDQRESNALLRQLLNGK